MREKLPSRRHADIYPVTHITPDGVEQEFILCVGRYDDGRPAECFVDIPWNGKAQMSLSVLAAKDAAVLISIALQHGVAIEEMRASVGKGDVARMGETVELPHTIIGTMLHAIPDLP